MAVAGSVELCRTAVRRQFLAMLWSSSQHRRIITLVRSELCPERVSLCLFQVLVLQFGQSDSCCVFVWLHRLVHPVGRVMCTVLVLLQVWCAECSGSTTIVILLPTAAANPDADRLLLHAAACLHTAGAWVPTWTVVLKTCRLSMKLASLVKIEEHVF